MAGVYLHIPFCLGKCGYCAFHSRPLRNEAELKDYLHAIQTELSMRCDRLAEAEIETIYFGGGTPSLASPDDLHQILQLTFSISGSAKLLREVTLEANPETLSRSNLQQFRQSGISRLSLGAQSFQPDALAFLERRHRPEHVAKVFYEAREAGFENISLDLIVGLPAPFDRHYRADIEQAVQLRPEHISVYLLSADEPSKMHGKVKSGEIVLLDVDEQADVFLACHDLLIEKGYMHYEISNYARPGFESLHNTAYWSGKPYLGIGAGAHSYWSIDGKWTRYANVADPDEYVRKALNREDPTEFIEIISPEMEMREKIMLALRTAHGIRPADFGPYQHAVSSELRKLLVNGWYTYDGERFRPTPAGMLVADGLSKILWDCLESEAAPNH